MASRLVSAVVASVVGLALVRRLLRAAQLVADETGASTPPVWLDASDADADAVAACVRAHGVCCVRGFFAEAQVLRWAEELTELRAAGRATATRSRNTGRTEFNFAPSERPFGKADGGLLADARLVAMLKRLLGAKVRVETVGSVLALPGAPAQRWHQDVPHLFATGAQLPVHFVAVFVPLVPISRENGPTEFCVGSHVRAAAALPRRELALECPLGSLVLFDGRVLHRGGANLSAAAEREVLFLNVCRHWFRDMSNKVEHKVEPLL
jgi:hypothetical protein